MRLEELQHAVRAAITDPALTYRQRVQLLATLAENALDPPPLTAATQEALDKRVICDMYEGNAPYRPRYVLPDYPKALRQGSQFLELRPPTDLDEALTFLLRCTPTCRRSPGTPCISATLMSCSPGSSTRCPTPSCTGRCATSG
jgi:hypothetical protein